MYWGQKSFCLNEFAFPRKGQSEGNTHFHPIIFYLPCCWLSSCGAQGQAIPNLNPCLILVSHLSYETDPLWLLVGAVWTTLSSIAKDPNALL